MSIFPRKKLSPRLQQLAHIPLFSTLTPAGLMVVERLLHEREYVSNEVIFDEGEEAQALYIVLSGRVLISRQTSSGLQRIAELGPGQFFGDMALLDNSPRSAQARAAENCVLAAFFREDFIGLLETHAAIASKLSLQLARHLGNRLRDALQAKPFE
jgi:CRP-like cAMP-binding protein